MGVGCASRDSAGGMVAGEDEETDGDEVADEGDEVADEGVAVESSVEEGASRTWQEHSNITMIVTMFVTMLAHCNVLQRSLQCL